MLTIGLTGGIACGKSTVLQALRAYPSIEIISTDDLAKEILSRTSSKTTLVSLFGEEVLMPSGVDFAHIAKHIFSEPHVRFALESFVHPLVWQEVEERKKTSTKSMLIVESAILYEVSAQDKFDCVVVVSCGESEQRRRMQVDRNMSQQQIDARLSTQFPLSDKVARADYVLDTECDFTGLQKRTTVLYEHLQQESNRRQQ